jgi:hypothetical protein
MLEPVERPAIISSVARGAVLFCRAVFDAAFNSLVKFYELAQGRVKFIDRAGAKRSNQ